MPPSDPAIAPIGVQIRDLRTARGLTLQELAAEAGTSAPAVHRYEGHWEGYTIRTLRRIAEALDADLEVRLTPRTRLPVPPPAGDRPSERAFLERIRSLFWDVDLTASDLSDHVLWILTRILNEGGLAQVRSALAFYGPEPFSSVLDRRGLSPRARSFLTAFLKERG